MLLDLLKIFPSFNPLGQFYKLRGRYFNKKYHKLKARGLEQMILPPILPEGKGSKVRDHLPIPFIVTHASIITWDCLTS